MFVKEQCKMKKDFVTPTMCFFFDILDVFKKKIETGDSRRNHLKGFVNESNKIKFSVSQFKTALYVWLSMSPIY